MFQGQIDLDTAIAVEATAIPDVLFERGLYWASGRSGVVNLVAAHKWFNLAALKGRADAISMRRDQINDAGAAARPIQAALEQHVRDRICFHQRCRILIDVSLKHLTSPLFDFVAALSSSAAPVVIALAVCRLVGMIMTDQI